MRHRVKNRKLKRPTPHRLLLLRGLACDLIIHEKIKTTTAKAKELRSFIEKLITIAKEYDPQNTKSPNSINSARRVFSALQNKQAVKKLLNEIAPRYKNLNGGYTRIIKDERRKGDNAELSVITFVEPAEKIQLQIEKR
jgi:large subunit ribosomal protein L17